MTSVPSDFEDMARALSVAGARFMVVGAHALAVHAEPRATGDIDFWVAPDPDNAARVFQALVDFGAPVAAHGVSAADFRAPNVVYQIGLPPLRIENKLASGRPKDLADAEVLRAVLARGPLRD